MKKILLLPAILLITVFTNGQCTSGDCENGFGTYVFQGGGTYTGDWKNGKREGKGTFTWTKGDVYIGDWVANAETGSCVYSFANGQKYVGEINNNNYEGEGSFILPNGYYKKGIFKNDVAVTIKYFNDKNIEIPVEKFNEALREVDAKKKEKLQILNLKIPAPNGVYTISDRANDLKMQFCTSSKNLLCLWGNTPTFYTTNDMKLINRLSYYSLTQSEIGREVIADFNKTSSTTNSGSSPHFNQKGEGYANKKFQIKINKGKAFGINNDSTYTVTLYNYQKFIDDETLPKFSFWKNSDERKAYHKKEKEAYFDVFDDQKFDSRDRKKAKDEYEDKSRTKLTDIHATYDSIKSMAHVVFTFSHLRYDHSYNVMYDIDFKNKTSKKIGESEYEATVNDDCYSYITSKVVDKTKKETFSNYRIVNFNENSILDIDKSYIDKLNGLTNPSGDVKFIDVNKDYLIFEGYHKPNESDAYFIRSYYYVNKSSNFCEKIININYPKYISNNIVFNSDYSKAAFSQKYKLNPNDDNFVNSVCVLDLENLTAKLIDDHQYQTEAINNKIIQDKEAKRQSDEKYAEIHNKNMQVTQRDAEIHAQNAAAQAERTAKCLCCHGTGQKETKGMYLGTKTYSVTPINGLGISHEEVINQYGASTYSPCTCCRR